MKHKFESLLCAVLLFVPLALFTGCSDDDDDIETLQPEKPVNLNADVYYQIRSLGELLDYVDVTVSYKDAEGNMQSERIESVPWTKTVEDFKIPLEAYMEISYVRKDNVSFDKQTYFFDYSYLIEVVPDDTNSYIVQKTQWVASMPVERDKVELYLESLETKPQVYTVPFD